MTGSCSAVRLLCSITNTPTFDFKIHVRDVSSLKLSLYFLDKLLECEHSGVGYQVQNVTLKHSVRIYQFYDDLPFIHDNPNTDCSYERQ